MLEASLVLPALAAVLGAQQGAPAGENGPLRPGAAIELPGVEGRIDHLAVDLARERLFFAARGNDSVEVVDLRQGRRTRSLRGPLAPQGILYLSDCDRMVVASGGAGTCAVYVGESLEEIATVRVGGDVDNLRYDPRRKLVYAAYGEGGLGIIDTESWKVAGRVALSGHPEGFQLDPAGERAYVNVPDARGIAVVDLDERAVLTTWKLEAAANYPMALVPRGAFPGSLAEGGLLVGCRAPSDLVLLTMNGKPLDEQELAGDVDDVFCDVRRKRVYAACGRGFVDVFASDEKGFRELARVATARGARTCLYVPEWSRLFVAVPKRGTQAAEIRAFDAVD